MPVPTKPCFLFTRVIKDFRFKRDFRPLQPFWKFLRFWCHCLLRGHMINWFCQFAVLTQKTPPKTKNPKQQTNNPKTLAPSANQELGKHHGQLTEAFPMVQVGSCIFKIKHKHIPQPRAACTTAINISSFFTQIFPFETIWQLRNYLQTCTNWPQITLFCQQIRHLANFNHLTWGLLGTITPSSASM